MRRITPAVSRAARLLLAGGTWSAVGVMLLVWAANWLAPLQPIEAAGLGVMGIALGIIAWRGMFVSLARANIKRLASGRARACVFGFVAPRAWLITLSMVLLGTTLRHSALPKPWLAVIYAAIGVALFAASTSYYQHLIRPTQRRVR